MSQKYDYAYLAGLIDGEGCFSIRNKVNKQGGSHGSTLAIYNSNTEIMEWLVAKFGGSVYTNERQNKEHKTGYRWSPFADRLDSIVEGCIPHLIIKKDHAILFRAYRIYRDTVYPRNRRASPYVEATTIALSDTMAFLNQRGN